MKPSARAVVVTLIAVLLPGVVIGQVKSDEPVQSVRISGRVTDAVGAPVADAAVVVKLAGTNDTTASAKTSVTGEYTFLVVPHRSYELHFERPGFRRETKVVTADKDTDVGTLALSVSGFAGSGRVVTESPVELPGSAHATHAIMNNESQAQDSTNIYCVERMEIPRYPLLPSQARIEGSITASVALSSDGVVHDIKITAQSKSRQAKNLFGPTVGKVIRAAQFRSGCSEKAIKLVFHFDLKGMSDSPKASMSYGYPNVFWIVSEAPLVQPEAQASANSDLTPGNQDEGRTHKPKQSTLWAAISVPQPIFVEGYEAEHLQIYFAVYNDSESAIAPNVESSHLFVNGVEPEDWSYVIGNGIRNELFSSLPPGQTLQFTYLLGPRYFLKPGLYTLRWEGENFKSPDLTFRVVPRSR